MLLGHERSAPLPVVANLDVLAVPARHKVPPLPEHWATVRPSSPLRLHNVAAHFTRALAFGLLNGCKRCSVHASLQNDLAQIQVPSHAANLVFAHGAHRHWYKPTCLLWLRFLFPTQGDHDVDADVAVRVAEHILVPWQWVSHWRALLLRVRVERGGSNGPLHGIFAEEVAPLPKPLPAHRATPCALNDVAGDDSRTFVRSPHPWIKRRVVVRLVELVEGQLVTLVDAPLGQQRLHVLVPLHGRCKHVALLHLVLWNIRAQIFHRRLRVPVHLVEHDPTSGAVWVGVPSPRPGRPVSATRQALRHLDPRCSTDTC
mmetsp:Transcript_273/g.761  ORF Transcript_273/g.761 Transcript_273/m.761 type:complete len:315 (+) Transcript_273:242-1186(+)